MTVSKSSPETANPSLMLALATLGFALSFWAWNLISPLGSIFGDEFGLSDVQQSLVVATPVVVGSIGRIPVGALTDKYGARVMFPAVTSLTILPVLYVGFFGTSYAALLVGGFFLGLGGTAFAVGIPFVNAWYPPARRGLALGIFGMGTAGTAISAFTTVELHDALGQEGPFVIVAVALAIYAVVAWLLLRDSPDRKVASGSMVSRTWSALKQPVTLKLSWLYAIAFGGFVAFSVYLPTYLGNAYDLSDSDAAARTAGFVLVAVAMRPIGGALSDRIGAVPVLVTCYLSAAALAVLAAAELELLPAGTVAFLGLAAVLGAGSGATFALVAKLVEPAKVGSVTGVVGAAGGLGGFLPPLIMGAVYSQTDEYTAGLLLLALTALLTGIFTWRAFGASAQPPTSTEGPST